MSVSDAGKLSAEGIIIAELSRLPFLSCFLDLLLDTPLSTAGILKFKQSFLCPTHTYIRLIITIRITFCFVF